MHSGKIMIKTLTELTIYLALKGFLYKRGTMTRKE